METDQRVEYVSYVDSNGGTRTTGSDWNECTHKTATDQKVSAEERGKQHVSEKWRRKDARLFAHGYGGFLYFERLRWLLVLLGRFLEPHSVTVGSAVLFLKLLGSGPRTL
jgi:hypothetical protein